jgi:predicted ATPase
MIKSFKITGLWNRQDYVFDENTIHSDINIFTGSNGSGKTTILKLMWYMLSGQLQQAVSEIEFKEVELKTINEYCSIKKRFSQKGEKDKYGSIIPFNTPIIDAIFLMLDNRNPHNNRYTINQTPQNAILEQVSKFFPSDIPSYYFPTFRRIEGGYSFGQKNETNDIIERFRDFSKRMSHQNHQMLAFADFEDVKALINQVSSDIATELRPYEDDFTQFLSTITHGNSQGINTSELQEKLKTLEQKRNELRKPLVVLSKYIDDFFFEKSVKVTEQLTLGTHQNRVPLEHLSSGEKNFLSFIIYAMSAKNGIMFIDEPELTLHIDWQRALLPILREIAPNIQLFVATHAATIYSNFPDKDIWLDAQIASKEIVNE